MLGMSLLQSTVYSLPMITDAPNLSAIALISAVGPAKREVPESTMALLVVDTESPPRVTPSSATCQYPSELSGTYEKSPDTCLGSTPPKTSSPGALFAK